MIKILVFLPNLNMKEQFKKIIRKYKCQSNIKIELVYILGTPNSLDQNEDADVFVARGMTYENLKKNFSEKHIVEIKMTSFDIFNALIQCKNKYSSQRIALCIHNIKIPYLKELENICQAKIDIYDVNCEKSAKEAIEIASSKNTDTYVGAGTICSICNQHNLQNIHIKTENEAIEAALNKAINTTLIIEKERIRSIIFKTIINKSLNGIITINKYGNIQQINNRAYQFFQLSTIYNIQNQTINSINKNLHWKDAIKKDYVSEEVIKLDNKNYFLIQYIPILIEKKTIGLIIIVKNSEEIFKEEIKIRHSLREQGLTAKYSFNDILGESEEIKNIVNIAMKYSRVDSNVLIVGETGTGKELFAHSIHQASKRNKKPFVAINCAALPENLLESELFGYESGSFSGASKN